MISLALYQPEIPQNTGTLMRFAACMGIKLYIIEPCGFGLSDAKLKRSGMDYLDLAAYRRLDHYEAFEEMVANDRRRVIITSPRATVSYSDFKFQSSDIILMGRESDGLPEDVMKRHQHQVSIPMIADCRSLNIAVAASMITGEALRQCNQFN